MFVVVRNIKNKEEQSDFSNEYKISKGDIIKMGRIKFQVKDYRTPREPAMMDSNDASPIKRSFRKTEDCEDFAAEEEVEIDCGVADSDTNCKVCWSNEQDITNPLLSSCNCDGSVRFIHF